MTSGGRPTAHWILGILYINPDDARRFVPLPSRLGWAINFGHRDSVRVIFWIWVLVILTLICAPIVAHPSFFAADPTPVLRVWLALLAAFAIIRLNGSFAWRDYRLVPLASFGLLAAGIGFFLQGVVNRPLVAFWGAESLSWRHHLVLAPVAAVAQTFGKGATIMLIMKARPVAEARDVAKHGLLIGLGFAAVEITNIHFAMAWTQTVTSGFLGVWERASSSMFHIYSGGLIALALWCRRAVPWVIVLVVHAVSDLLAGIGTGTGLSVYLLEAVFSLCAVMVWGAFLLSTRSGASFAKRLRRMRPAR